MARHPYDLAEHGRAVAARLVRRGEMEDAAVVRELANTAVMLHEARKNVG